VSPEFAATRFAQRWRHLVTAKLGAESLATVRRTSVEGFLRLIGETIVERARPRLAARKASFFFYAKNYFSPYFLFQLIPNKIQPLAKPGVVYGLLVPL